MSSKDKLAYARPGDLALLVGRDRKQPMIRLEPGRILETHRGTLAHDELIGKPWGSQISTHLGQRYIMLPPSLHQQVLKLRRISQIIYPKDAGYILLKMSIGPGTHVVEAGTGSGGLTLMLAHTVRPDGRIYSYEVRAEMQRQAQRNLEKAGLANVVDFKLRDIIEGFDETGVEALFLDLPNPWDYLEQAHAALINGGYFGTILPTANQVADLLGALEKSPFGFVEVEEIMLRPYKPVPARLRPADRMIAHTGFLVFARALLSPADTPSDRDHQEEGKSDDT